MTGKPKIPEARAKIEEVLDYHNIQVETRIKLREALGLMYRQKYKEKNAFPLRYLQEPCRKCGAAAGENCKHSNSKENNAKPDEQAADGLKEA